MVTHLEADILECDVKGAWEAMNKASGGDGIPAEPFRILKDNAVKDDAFYMATNLENSSMATGLEKVSFSFQSQRRTVPKNVPTTVPLCLFYILARSCSKSFKLGFSST